MSEKQKLLAEFESVPFETWKAKAIADLKGAPYEKKLITKTYEGFDIQPVYTAADTDDLPYLKSNPGTGTLARGITAEGYIDRSWEVSQELPYPSPREFNDAARHDLSRGLTAVNLSLDAATRAGQDPDSAKSGEIGKGGVSIASIKDLSTALEDIDLEKTPLFIRSGASGLPFAALLAALFKSRGLDLKKLHGSIENDPLGVILHEGTLPQSLDEAYRELAQLTAWAHREAPALQTVTVHSRSFLEAGGSAVQELGFSLAIGAEYLRELGKRGQSVDVVAPRMRFAFSIGSNFFMEIAKFRAARLLWSHVVEAFGGNKCSQSMNIHARTALWNKSKLDPYANLLRTTTESFSAVLGGVQSLQVGPFDEVFGLPDEFSRRIARNQQILLATEAQLRHVVDPAGGSWAVEWLTDQIARKAWELFQQVEGKGGAYAALKDGFVQSEIEKVAKSRESALASRKDSQVGVNQYANLKEKKVESRVPDYAAIAKSRAAEVSKYRTTNVGAGHAKVLGKLSELLGATDAKLLDAAIEAVQSGATLGEITRVIRANDAERPVVKPLKLHRLSEPFEALRGASDAFLEKTGSRPKVFLATMGPVSQHKGRGDFSRGFFEVAGFDVVYPKGGFDTATAAVEAAKASRAKVVVVCSTDDTYPEIVPQLVPALKAAIPGVTAVLAGYPTDQIEAHKASGIDEFIHVRANLLAVLGGLQKKIGVVA